MKKFVLLMAATVGLLSGCVVYDEPYRDGHRYSDRDHYGDRSRSWDRDHDGVPNREDRRPDDPTRY